MDKDFDAVLKEIEEHEQIRKSDAIVEELNLRIDELGQRLDRQEVNRIIRDSIKADENYFADEE